EELMAPIKRIMREVAEINPSSLEIVNRPPTRSKPIYMKVWEARKADGLDYDEQDESQQAWLSEITKYNVTKIN
ncbi:MAG: phage portal protein, partial [Alistipes sp.]|nr:phage portal protein [Alistipes sp.]